MSKTDSKSDSSETAGFLAAVVGGLDSIASERFTRSEELYQKVVVHHVNGFFDAYRSAKRNVIPLLSSLHQNAPVRHAGVSGTSYHEVVCKLAEKQYRAMFFRLDPERCLRCIERRLSLFDHFQGDEISAENVIDDWNEVADDLAEIFANTEKIDSEFLCAGVKIERIQPITDGPCGNCQWRHDGAVADGTMQPGAWGVCKYIWALTDKSASFDSLYEPATGDREDKLFDFKSAAQKAKQFFDLHEIPLRLSVSEKQRTVTLVEK